MSKRGEADTSTLTIGFIIVGSIIALIFLSAGIRAGNVSYLKNELYAKDQALLANTLLSVPADTDFIVKYPHDFTDYTLTYDSEQAIVSYKTDQSRATYPYFSNSNYDFSLSPQTDHVQYIKFGKTIRDHAPQKSGS